MTYRSPEKAAWDRILGKYWSHERREGMKSLFPNPDLDELYEFSLLHKIVLGLISGHSVESLMRMDPNQIDMPDSTGRTPLFWAVIRGDSGATQQLLSCGPDLNRQDLFL